MSKQTYKVGDKVTKSGYPGTIIRVCEWSTDLYEVRLESGVVCVDGSDLVPQA